MYNHEKGELAKDILLAFLAGSAIVGMALAFITFPGLAHLVKLFPVKNNDERNRIRQAVKRLERRGYIELIKKNNKEFLKITSLGEKRVAEHLLVQQRAPKPKKWDGYWRIVMFDIPENKRRVRNALRFMFQKMEFEQIQKSVFVYPYPCKKEVDFIANYFQINNGIRYAVVKDLDRDTSLKKKFGLP